MLNQTPVPSDPGYRPCGRWPHPCPAAARGARDGFRAGGGGADLGQAQRSLWATRASAQANRKLFAGGRVARGYFFLGFVFFGFFCLPTGRVSSGTLYSSRRRSSSVLSSFSNEANLGFRTMPEIVWAQSQTRSAKKSAESDEIAPRTPCKAESAEF